MLQPLHKLSVPCRSAQFISLLKSRGRGRGVWHEQKQRREGRGSQGGIFTKIREDREREGHAQGDKGYRVRVDTVGYSVGVNTVGYSVGVDTEGYSVGVDSVGYSVWVDTEGYSVGVDTVGYSVGVDT